MTNAKYAGFVLTEDDGYPAICTTADEHVCYADAGDTLAALLDKVDEWADRSAEADDRRRVADLERDVDEMDKTISEYAQTVDQMESELWKLHSAADSAAVVLHSIRWTNPELEAAIGPALRAIEETRERYA